MATDSTRCTAVADRHIARPTATRHGWTGRWRALCSARYASPTTFNEAKRGRLGGQTCRRNSAVARHVLTEAITVSCHRVSRSNCDAVTNRPVAHPLLGPCHTLSDTVIGLAPCGSTDRLSTNSRFGAPCCRSLAHATAPSPTGFSVLLTLQRTGRDCGAFAIQFADENRRHPVCSRRA
jgi:hypothetical protein